MSPRVVLLTLCASAFGAGLLLLSWEAATRLAVYLSPPPLRAGAAGGFGDGSWLVSAGLLVSLGLLGGVLGLLRLPVDSTVRDRAEQQIYRYNVALVGVGLALVLVGSMHFVALAGFAHMGQLRVLLRPEAAGVMEPSPAPRTPAGQPVDRPTAARPDAAGVRVVVGAPDTVRLVFLPGFAVLGGLFFVAGSLRRKRRAIVVARGGTGPPSFDSAHFWGGLWYRLGEAILFTLVLYLAVQSQLIDVGVQNQTWVLLVGLLMGMFVKPAEQLINGLGLRLLDAISAFVAERAPAPAPPRGETATDAGREGSELPVTRAGLALERPDHT